MVLSRLACQYLNMKRQAIEQESAASWVCSDEFQARIRVYFYVVAVIVASQLLWMIDHYVGVLNSGSMECINTKSPIELGFTPLQIEKMESGQPRPNLTGIIQPDSPV